MQKYRISPLDQEKKCVWIKLKIIFLVKESTACKENRFKNFEDAGSNIFWKKKKKNPAA